MQRNERNEIIKSFVRTFGCMTRSELECFIGRTTENIGTAITTVVRMHFVWPYAEDGRILLSSPRGKIDWGRVKAGWAYVFLGPNDFDTREDLFLYNADEPSTAIYEKNGNIYEIAYIETRERLQLLREEYKTKIYHKCTLPVRFVFVLEDEKMCEYIQQFSNEFDVKCLGIMLNFPGHDLFSKPEAVFYEFS